MKEFRSNYALYLVGALCTILILISLISFHYISFANTNMDNYVLKDKTELVDKDKYDIQIKYPLFKDNKINKDIKKFIKNEKKLFKDSIKEVYSYDNVLNINYSYTIKDNLYSIHIRSYSYIDSTYHREDILIYYDSILNKVIEYKDIILNNKFYEVLRNNCYDYLMDNNDKYDLYDINLIKKVLVADRSNYELVSFNEDNIEVIFKPHTVSEYDNEIIVNVKYSDVIKYLNKDYFSDVISDVTTDNINKKYDRIRESKDFENKKLIALTFDDGPAYAKTDKLLTELEKRDARVTFFMLGELAIKQKDLVKKAYDYGHTIGSHTYDHKNLKKLDDEQLSFEIDYTNEILSNIINDDIRFIRPPYGAYNQNIVDNTNMAFILWNVDTLDWKLRDAIKVRDYIVEHANDGDIILLHDIHSTSVDGAIMAIDILKNEGYEFVSLDELLVYKNINIQSRKAYRFFK